MSKDKIYSTIELTKEQHDDLLLILVHYATRPHMEHGVHENCAKKIATLISKIGCSLKVV